jgi:uncharacterized protein (DUF433 family)
VAIDDARLLLPGYRQAEAARFAQTTSATVARWFRGYEAPGHRMAPVLPKREGGLLAYLELVEVAFVADFRRLGMPLERLRQSHDYLRAQLDVAHPFAQLRFKTDGVHLLAQLEGALIAADARGQLSWPSMIEERLGQFDYEGEIACRWHLRGRATPIVLDPSVALGAPVVLGTSVPTWAVRDRRRAGEPSDEIARDLGLSAEQMLAALRFEGLA